MSPAEILKQKVPLIDRIVLQVGRKNGLDTNACEEFRGVVYERLIENDYRILRQHRGAEVATSYLILVIRNLYSDFYRSQKGRWRPSAAAKRAGEVGVILDELLNKKKLSFEEAYQTIRSQYLNQGGTPPDRESIAEIAGQLKARPRPSVTTPGHEILEAVAVETATPADAFHKTELGGIRQQISRIIRDAMTDMSSELLLVFRMVFEDDHSISSVARVIGKKRAWVDNQIKQELQRIRQRLNHAGIADEDAVEVLNNLRGIN